MSSVMKVDSITKSDGTAGVHIAGHVIQVVSATYQTQATTTSTSFVDTGLTASITPKFSSSKVFVTVSQAYSLTQSTDSQWQGNLIIADGSNNLLFGGTGYDQFRIKNMTAFHWQTNLQVLHSPNTASSFTYKTRMKAMISGTNVYSQYAGVAPSSITLMEIAQ
tara:strand:+ start:325 stop:816 length:492 start_codon:yes stop_codon:yes gene_type:complete